jgi:Proline racemase
MDALTVIDMHTGGEPVRIVTGGYPPIPKGTILEKRAYVRDNDMYGALLVEPDLPGADLAVLFMHNEGYSTMCGHAIVALGRYAIDQGLVTAQEPVTEVKIECPCGMVVASVEVEAGRPDGSRSKVFRRFSLGGTKAWTCPYGARSGSTSPMGAHSTPWPIAGSSDWSLGATARGTLSMRPLR